MKTTIVSVEWLSEHLNQSNLVVLDASLKKNQANLQPKQANIQIKGARFFDLKHQFSDLSSSIPNMMLAADLFAIECQKLGINKDSKIVVYDNLGIYSSPRVWWMFKHMGHTDIAVLNGGLPAWIAADAPTEFTTAAPKSFKAGNFECNYQEQSVFSQSQVKTNITTQKAVLIDARSEERFLGQVSESRSNLRSGHIPKAINIPFKTVLQDGFLKKKKELLDIVSSLHLEQKPLIFSCGSGVTACIVMLALETVLDSPKMLYDGSWSEWGLLD